MSSATRETVAAIDSLWQLDCTQDSCIVAPDEAWLASQNIRVSREGSVSRLWCEKDWQRHTSPARYIDNLRRWPHSTILHSLAPLLAILAAWSTLVWRLHFTFSTGSVGYMASPLALLLAFRVNNAVARFHEARQIWQRVLYKARNLASLLAAAELPPEMVATCCRLLVSFGWACKAAVRYESQAELKPVLQALLLPKVAHGVSSARKPPLAILSHLRRATQSLDLPLHVAHAITQSLDELNRLYAAMERLMSTPLNPTYMRHTARGLALWLLMLPCALLSAGCSSLLKLIVVVCATAYITLGIDEIGIQIEQPFDVMPLHGLARMLTLDILDEVLVSGDQ